jgi:microcystin-dependent protein
MPTGTVSAFAGSTAPTGYVLCDGSEYSETTEAALFAVLGSTYNTGGETANHFRVPDLRGRVIAGQDDMGGTSANRLTDQSGGLNGDTLGATGGAETHLLTAAQSGLPSHSHASGVRASNNNYDVGSSNGTLQGTGINTGTTGGDDASSAHNNVQPTIILNYIIKT